MSDPTLAVMLSADTQSEKVESSFTCKEEYLDKWKK